MGLSTYAANKILDHVLGVAEWVPNPTPIHQTYISLHVGDPALTGASEISDGWYSRKQPEFGWNTATTSGVTNNGEVVWDAVDGPDRNVTHIGLWDAPSGGNFLFSIDIPDKNFSLGSVPKILDAAITITPGAAYSEYLIPLIGDYLVGNNKMSFDSSVHLALYTNNPGQGDSGTELTLGGYQRQEIGFDAASGGATDNTNEEDFGTASTGPQIATHFGIRTDSSPTPGNLHLFGPLSSNITIDNGDNYKAEIGAIDFSI